MTEQISPYILIGTVGIYFLVLVTIGILTGRKIDDKKFFLAGKKAPWGLVALGMIGSSISGVTFMSLPGAVGGMGKNMAFSYMQMVFGYLLGYAVIAFVLLPVYYKYNLTSIYGYLRERFGAFSQKTGSGFFLLSRLTQSAFRLFLVAMVMHHFILAGIGIPFWLTVAITIALIYLYTFKGGINTILWTDPLQTIVMLLTVVLTIGIIATQMDTSVGGLFAQVWKSDYSQMFFFEGGWSDPNNFFKQFLSGALITIVMTGLDQDMMQKNLSCRTLRESQKNVISYSLALVLVNVLFLSLGAILYLYINQAGLEVPARTDHLYPMLAFQYLPQIVGILFLLGMIAAAYSSADSALTALTTAFCIDFLGFDGDPAKARLHRRQRTQIHILFAVLLGLCILLFEQLSDDAILNQLFDAAGYTYGPLLGLFAFGLLTRLEVRDKWVVPICLSTPILSYILNKNSAAWFDGFEFGFTILAVNGLLTFIGLWVISYRK